MARLPKSIIKKYGITKKAWQVFRGRRKRPTRRIRRTRPSRKRGGTRRLVRRYRRKRRSSKSMIRTGFKLIRMGALFGPAAVRLTSSAPINQKLEDVLHDYTGYSMSGRNWELGRMINGWGPYIGACLATYGIPKLVSIIRRL